MEMEYVLILENDLSKSDVESIVSREVRSLYNSQELKKHIKKVTAEVIKDLFKTLWNRSSSWESGIVR